MSDLANEQACPCPACTPRPDVASQPGEALAALKRRWAAQESDDQPRSRRHWRRWIKGQHLHEEDK